ncbi:head-tail connector protein [Granulicella tundricola]|uniref:Phage gp6-like head-tail connector protein n=1 Tax=Granulicella tundricola (strain ATCC BAA-1859 / DSM 23138 / MP5ACTX9) TaxID=1198114 RepID=E8X0Q8_GRATM|nr:head-tail connector protein [Granulicella tundricola]ADW69009.1 phiE125 gp8 hypothetical protein [Granulicella tundricola MP5ACTX9]
MPDYQLTIPPVVEPVSLAEAKAHLRVDFPDEDSLIAGFISAAREMSEQKMQRAIFNQTYVLSLDQFNYGDWRSTIPMARRNPLNYTALWEATALRLPMPRLVSVTSITYVDTFGVTQTLDPSLYSVDKSSQPARIVPAPSGSWPTSDYYMPGSVKVTFVAGSYGDGIQVNTCPASIKAAILLVLGHLYENREASTVASLKILPLGVDALLSPYRFYGGM